jgi:hypothetical protein
LTREEVRARIAEIGIIPAVRVYSESEAMFAAEAVCGSGIPIVELTMTTPGALGVIGQLTRYSTDIIVGAGTIFDVDTARRCLDAGAGFLTSPGLDLEIVEFALKRGVAILPGALTPSEVMAAWKAGADLLGERRSRLHPGPQSAFPSHSADRLRRRNPEERSRFHPGGRDRARYRPAPDSPECHQAPPAGAYPRTGPAIHEHGGRCAQSIEGIPNMRR